MKSIMQEVYGSDESSGWAVAEELRTLVESLSMFSDYPVTVSIGIASLDPLKKLTEESWQQWIKRSDEALYLAKQKGRNRVEISSATMND